MLEDGEPEVLEGVMLRLVVVEYIGALEAAARVAALGDHARIMATMELRDRLE